MGGLTTKRNVAMFLIAAVMSQMAVARETVNSLQSNDVSELTVHSPFKEEESLNKLRAERAPAMTELFLEGPAQGECENVAQTLWDKYKEEAEKVFDTSFVQDLKNGITCNGSDAQFRYKFFIAQDAFYMKAAAVASYFMEFHEANVTTKKSLQERRLKDESYLEPLRLLIQNWTAAGWTEPSPVQAAIDYVSFDLGVAMNTSEVANVANTMASKAICVRLFMHIANTIKNQSSAETLDSNPYKEWIEENASTQSDDSYISSTEKLLNTVASTLSATDCQQLEHYYSEGLRHEIMFFKAVQQCPEDGNYGEHE